MGGLGSGRPGGNPDIGNIRRNPPLMSEGSCTLKKTIKLPQDWADSLPDDWPQVCRQTVRTMMEQGDTQARWQYDWGAELTHSKTIRVPENWRNRMPSGWQERCRYVLALKMGQMISDRPARNERQFNA